MISQKRFQLAEVSKYIMLAVGTLLMVFSAFVSSSFLAIFGTALIFWGIILFYLKPVKHVPLTFLAFAATGNIETVERLLSELALTEKGIYLPPRHLKNVESSLIFLPNRAKAELPQSDGITEKLFPKQKNGILITPPGLGLSLLFEKELNTSFGKTDFKYLQLNLPKLFIERLEIVEGIDLAMKNNLITIEVVGSIFDGVCQQTSSQPCTHAQIGCLFSSALACVLAKTVGKPIVIQGETLNPQTKTATIEFLILEADPALAVESPIRITLN